jgi:hypothetical protein
VRPALAAGLVGLVAWAVGVVVEPRQALTSYVFAYAAALTTVLGALMLRMIADVTGARWFDALRPAAEWTTDALPLLAVLALPLLVGVHEIYPWSRPDWLPVEARAVVARKRAWLDAPFFVARGLAYVAVWLFVRAALRRAARPRRASAVGIVACGLALTFAAFDWLMSLEPAWYSTVYGVYVFAGAALSALGGLLALADASHAWGIVPDPERVGAAGRMLLAYAMFWAYIAYAQYLVIWIGDVPADVSWYVVRTRGSWGVLWLAVGVGQFVIPFVLLLSRAVNRRPHRVAWIGGGLLVAHVLDTYWLVLPALHPAGARPSWLDAAALLLMGGSLAAVVGARSTRASAPAPAGPALGAAAGRA